MSRQKGNRFERDIARRLALVDPHPVIGKLASSTGRVGHLDLGFDVATSRLAIECKNRRSIPTILWDWLDHIDPLDLLPVVVFKRDGKRPLVLMDLDTLEQLLPSSPTQPNPSSKGMQDAN